MALATPPRKNLLQRVREKQNAPARLARWWDEFYARRRIWQLVAFIGFIFLLLMIFISWLLRMKVFGDIKGENVATTAMTMTGGLVAISYVVLKYRERISVERSERREEEQAADRKLGEAVHLLSDDKAIIQISGVYGLVAIADEFGGSYRQRVVDLLCAYIRGNTRKDYAAVEATIIGEIQKRVNEYHHYRSDLPAPNTSWSDCSFDFHGAVFFEKFRLVNAFLKHHVDCSEAVFHKGMELEDARMDRGLDCSNALFEEAVCIKFLIFQENDVNFNQAHFVRGFEAKHFSYPDESREQYYPRRERVTFYGARFDAWSIWDQPFTYAGDKPIETQTVSFYPKAPRDYTPNNTTVPELLRFIPVGSSVYWQGEELMEAEEK